MENWRMAEDLSDQEDKAYYAVLSPLSRLHHGSKKEGRTNAPLGAEMNLCWALVLTVYQLVQA